MAKPELDEALIERVREMHAAGASIDELIGFLAAVSTPKPYAMLILRRAQVLDLGQAKIAVHYHPAYEYRREADEEFQDAAIAAVEEIQARERAGSAAA